MVIRVQGVYCLKPTRLQYSRGCAQEKEVYSRDTRPIVMHACCAPTSCTQSRNLICIPHLPPPLPAYRLPHYIMSIQVQGSRIIVGDAQESVHMMRYKKVRTELRTSMSPLHVCVCVCVCVPCPQANALRIRHKCMFLVQAFVDMWHASGQPSGWVGWLR